MQKVIIVNDILGAARRFRSSIETAGYTNILIVKKAEGESLVDSAIKAADREFETGPGKDGIMILDLRFEGEGDYAGVEVLRWMRQNDRYQPVLLSTDYESELQYVLPPDLGYLWFPQSGDAVEIQEILGDARPLSDDKMEKARRALLSNHLRSHLISDVLSPLLPLDVDLQSYYFNKDENVFQDLGWANRNLSGEILRINEVIEGLRSAIFLIRAISDELRGSLTAHLSEIGGLLEHAFLKGMCEKLSSGDNQALVGWLSSECTEELYLSFHKAYEDAAMAFNRSVMELAKAESVDV